MNTVYGQALGDGADTDAAVMRLSQARFFSLIVFSDALDDSYQRFNEVLAVGVSAE